MALSTTEGVEASCMVVLSFKTWSCPRDWFSSAPRPGWPMTQPDGILAEDGGVTLRPGQRVFLPHHSY